MITEPIRYPTRGAGTHPARRRRAPEGGLDRFCQHYLGMAAAVVVAMVAFHPLWPAAWLQRGDGHALLDATDIAIAVAVWMNIRGRPGPRIAEMSAVVYLPFLVLLVPYWAGTIAEPALITAGHMIIFPLLLVAMLCRRWEWYR